MQLDGAFRVLLIPLVLMIGAAAEIVLRPSNLTLSCDNFNVTASWKYSRQHPNTRFKVLVQRDNNDSEHETADQHFDLSPFIWKSKESYMEVHSVSVTAMLGENQSQPVQSKTLTFNSLRPADIKCKLAFPPVDLKGDGLGVTVTFRNPLNFYKDLQKAGESGAYFWFNVTTAGGNSVTGTCLVNQEKCQREISFSEGEEKCVTLRGQLYDQIGARYVKFNETAPICFEDSTDFPEMILLAILLSATFIIVILIITAICLTKSWTMREVKILPSSLKLSKDCRTQYHVPHEEDFSAVVLIDNTTCKSPSVSSEEEDLQDDRDGSGARGTDVGYKEGAMLESSNQESETETLYSSRGGKSQINQGLEYSSSSTDDHSADDSVRTEEEEVEEEEEEVSPYDCPHNLLDNIKR
ncbi:interferon gamma receptor 1 [Notolabrus celidotus]|uniref:interferon gamma receptor 1 n=1 Tax=Notolabrus celidotus TaxID=1203425 RepID=UPI00148F902E|nr:interferon gamma receptor 1 [Notolabrus celidotus]